MKITYGSWDDDPAVLVEYSDGRAYAWVKTEGKGWQPAEVAEVAFKGRRLSEKQFKTMFPDVADLPKELEQP